LQPSNTAVAAKIIQNYSYAAAFGGGATALTGVVPGLGQIIAAFGGTTADSALCMKFQLEMIMALATLYDHTSFLALFRPLQARLFQSLTLFEIFRVF
jgi:hypothetical protein